MALIRYAALIGITAVLVVKLPKCFETSPPIFTAGNVAPGFEYVLTAFRENFETGRDPRTGGSAFAVYYRGEKVVDIWGGYADWESKQKWSEDTLSIFFSSTKGVAATCIAMLVDRGLLDYDKPVAEYWPEFAQKGKAKLTVRQMMEHKGGLVFAPPPGLNLEVLQDVSRAGELMSRAESQWHVDGETHGYHAFTIGPLANELLRRVDTNHRTMGQFFKEEVADPLGIDFHIGLPLKENHRVARLVVDKRPLLLQLISTISTPDGRQALIHILKHGRIDRVMENANELSDLSVFNDPSYRNIELSSANGFGTARGLAKMYGIIAVGGTDLASNKSLLSRKRVSEFTDAEPPSVDWTLGVPVSFNRGMSVQRDLIEDVHIFGHMGAGGQQGGADVKNQIGYAFLARHMLGGFTPRDDTRSLKLLEAVYQCVRKLQNS